MPPKEELENLGKDSQMEGLPPQELQVILPRLLHCFLVFWS